MVNPIEQIANLQISMSTQLSEGLKTGIENISVASNSLLTQISAPFSGNDIGNGAAPLDPAALLSSLFPFAGGTSIQRVPPRSNVAGIEERLRTLTLPVPGVSGMFKPAGV